MRVFLHGQVMPRISEVNMLRIAFLWSSVMSLVWMSTVWTSMVRADDGSSIDFEQQIRPILNTHCASCHGGVKKTSGFSVISRESMLAPTDSGQPAVVPGDDGCELVRRITADDAAERMPPEGHDALTEQQSKLLKQWIVDGAAWPGHWSYQPIPMLPNIQEFDGQHPVDWFVRRQLNSAGVQPSAPADRITLIRRISLDLTGLLPNPEDVAAFVSDESPNAVSTLASRYLASPHFGERWGRHWLDEARFADSEGYEKDSVKNDAYQFRDWVINAINDDMPFDDFTRKQLAGDLLPDATAADLIATKFHLQTQFNLEGGVDSEEDRTKRIIDRVGTVGAVWMGASVACCQCHDHPYDSFQQTDFYRLYAFFNNMDFRADYLLEEPDHAEKSREERKKKWDELASLLAKQLTDKNYSNQTQSRLSTLRTFDNSKQFTRYMYERQEDRRTTWVFARGDFQRPMTEAGEITADVPSVLGRVGQRGDTPDRLDLANWLVSSENALTARVTVNKIWMHLFGQPLAEQPQEFGSRGSRASHPELLDYLARWFVDESGWSRKKLIHFLVTSHTYQQSSFGRPELRETDPDNRLLARQNRFRVEAEIVRDISLQAAALLSEKVGGPSVFPPLPAIITQQTYAGSFKYKASTGPDRYRRGLYTFFRRTAIDPNLSTFDCPDSSMTRAERDRSNNPLQALATMHNEVFHEAAQGFAQRILQLPGGDAERLDQTYRIALGRPAVEQELTVLVGLLTASRDWYADHEADAVKLIGPHSAADVSPSENAAWIATLRVILNLDEFLTRS